MKSDLRKVKPEVTAKEKGESKLQDVWIPAMCESQCIEGPCMIRVHRVNGVAVNIEPNTQGEDFEKYSKNRGRVCPKSYGLLQKLYNPHRIKGPLKRTNPEKGRGVDPGWVSISWDEALDIIAEKLKKIRNDDSRKLAQGLGVGASCDAWLSFFDAFGPVQTLQGGRSTRCRQSEHSIGSRIHGAYNCDPDLEYCNYRLLFGGNTTPSGGTAEAVQFADDIERNVKMVVLDPVLTATASKAAEWLPIKPCTDTAFMLAMINVIINELGIYDTEFLKQMTNSPYLVKPDGYFMRDEKVLVWDPVDNKAKTYDDATIKDFALEGSYDVGGIKCKPAFQVLKEHVKQYTPEWAATITEISADTIRRISKELVENARIGSTININGVTLPYRPVAVEIGRGVNAVMRAYQSILAMHILAALIGALEVPGGLVGGQLSDSRKLTRDGILFRLGPYAPGMVTGDDGMTEVHAHPFIWPPKTYDAVESLCPMSEKFPLDKPPYTSLPAQAFRMDHLCWRNLVDPPKGFPLPPLPELWIRYRCNPLLGLGESQVVAEAMKKIPFIVSISYTEDEVTDYADILLPEQIELERYTLCYMLKTAGKKYFEIALQQPVIEPLHNTMNVNQIFTELADRIGMLSEYNKKVNEKLDLKDPYKLELNKKYSREEVVDRQCKSYTSGRYDLEWFKKNGAIVRPVDVEYQYQVHLFMKAHKLRYPIPYMEQVKRIGEDLARNLAEKGIDWWRTDEYQALPSYYPPILDEMPPEYDFYVTTSHDYMFTMGTNVGIPWMNEVGNHMKHKMNIQMNADTARARGIKEGDEIWVESPVGKVKRRVSLCQGIRPDTLLIAGQFGQWKMPIARDTGRVTISTLIPISIKWTDPVIGNQQGQTIKAKVYKA